MAPKKSTKSQKETPVLAPEAEPAAPAAPAETPATPPPSEVAAPAAEATPAAPVEPVSGSPTEIYNQLQAIVSADPLKINDYESQVLQLMQVSEQPDTPLLLRVRFLEFVGRNVTNIRDNSALKKIVTSLVKIISGPDNTPQLLIATLQCFAGLGPVSMVDKRWEYLSREGSDVVMQVMLDKESFPENVRQAASRTLDSLTQSAFRSVVTKLLHWISDDREEDAEEQLVKERRMALNRLTKLAFSPSMRPHWTPEVQEYVLALIHRILATVDAHELHQLVRVAAHLPANSEHGCIPLLRAFLAANTLDSERSLESLDAIAKFVSPTAELDLVPSLEAAGLLSGDLPREGERGVYLSRALLLATRLATADGVEKLLPFIFSQMAALVGQGTELPADLSVLEAVLFAVVAAARKKPTEVLQKLNEEATSAAFGTLVNTIANVEPLAIFAVKKLIQREQPHGAEVKLLASLHNIKIMAGAFGAKHLPMGELKESWLGRHKPPAVKGVRQETVAGLTRAGAAGRNGAKRSRKESPHRGGGGSRKQSRTHNSRQRNGRS